MAMFHIGINKINGNHGERSLELGTGTESWAIGFTDGDWVLNQLSVSKCVTFKIEYICSFAS
ncbi:hypothetical protein UNDYM_0592 [Undibacterium sp. YM2]|nr:hypothetical protein UNDYM_0592 [Undibacterium sp. YM2]